MFTARSTDSRATLTSLQAAEASARDGFACLFSTSDEFETALITQRRAQGRYAPPHSKWPKVMFAGCVLMVAGAVVWLA